VSLNSPQPTRYQSHANNTQAKHAEAAKQSKKGWGFTSWFGGSAKKEQLQQQQEPGNPNKPIRAKLGEPNSFYYDPELKRWVNKSAGGAEDNVKKSTPPPPKGAPRSASSSPAPPPSARLAPPGAGEGRASAPPTGPPRSVSLGPSSTLPGGSEPNLLAPSGGGPPPGPVGMLRSVSNTSTASAPPTSRPALSNSSSIDDLIGAAGPRRAGQKKPRKSARYVDVMAK
jgi:hypothetical protein